MVKVAITGGIIALGLLWTLAARADLAGEAHRYVKPASQAAGLTHCVEPTNFMRRNHMELIKHQRDATVHSGIRSTKHSLAGCINCHVSVDPQGKALPINGRDQFCGACHAFSAVDVNCFGCHASVPKGGPASEEAMARSLTGPLARPGTGEEAAQAEWLHPVAPPQAGHPGPAVVQVGGQ